MGFADDIAAAIGKNDDPTTVKSWLNTGHPLLNDAISGSYHGGLPVGRIVEMYGPNSAGKTAIATAVMIQAQLMGGVAAFMDHEHSFDHNLAERNGLDLNGNWIFKTPSTFEQSTTLAVKAAQTIRVKRMIPDESPIVFVFDSLASMVPAVKMEKNLDEGTMHDKLALAAATSAAFPVLAKFCEDNQFTALFLNQVREKPGIAYGDSTTTPGGNAPGFYASVRIALTKSMLRDKEKSVVGQTVKAEVKKNKVHRPFEKAEWDFMFRDDGTGFFDPVPAVIEHLIAKNVLTRSGAFIEWDGKKLHKQEIVRRINDSGDREQLYKLLPGYDADRTAADHKIDWNQF